jgi:hypothetical protein
MKFKNTDAVQWSPVGCSEVIENDPNPEFFTRFSLVYHFEEQSFLKFIVVKTKTGKAEEGILHGEME